MSNIFKQQKDVNNKSKRNNFDLSFQNHATFKFGKLYPVFCKEVVPDDSFRIDSAFGLKFMPMVFPVQSKMRASMHFYYVRNKNLWDRWEDWISGLKGVADGVVHPYISRPASYFRTGSLLDYFNVPTTIADGVNGFISFVPNRQMHAYNNRNSIDLYNNPLSVVPSGVTYKGTVFAPSPVWFGGTTLAQLSQVEGILSYNEFVIPSTATDYRSSFAYLSDEVFNLSGRSTFSAKFDTALQDGTTAKLAFLLFLKNSDGQYILEKSSSVSSTASSGSFNFSQTYTNLKSGEYKIAACFEVSSEMSSWGDFFSIFGVFNNFTFEGNNVRIIDTLATPFSSSADVVRISALPFRAYESIMNCFYRNNVVDPFKPNGVPEYNRFITNNSGGADSTTPVELYERNYEFDFLTSSLPSPQQGIAPLVGFSALGDVTVTDEKGNPINATFELAEDSNFTGKVSIHNPSASNAVKSYLSQAGMALAGLSINDFRNVNALQRWLETNIRKGYRYMDFIEGHFGKSPKYNELDMPEFIGGYSRDVNVSQIIQTSDMGVIDENAGTLGSFAGMASCFGGSQHSISHYCDDYGFIIGIMCVTPTPSYSQLLPKFYLKNNPLDYYFPEFSQLGMQPITYEEVTPLSAYQYNVANPNNPKPLTDTFGYQRPNYDLVASVDEVHGQFRTSLRDFLISRYFATRPELGRDFIKINNDDVNSIFSINSSADDNILGQIIFKVYAKRPIPRVVIPSLGR